MVSHTSVGCSSGLISSMPDDPVTAICCIDHSPTSSIRLLHYPVLDSDTIRFSIRALDVSGQSPSSPEHYPLPPALAEVSADPPLLAAFSPLLLSFPPGRTRGVPASDTIRFSIRTLSGPQFGNYPVLNSGIIPYSIGTSSSVRFGHYPVLTSGIIRCDVLSHTKLRTGTPLTWLPRLLTVTPTNSGHRLSVRAACVSWSSRSTAVTAGY